MAAAAAAVPYTIYDALLACNVPIAPAFGGLTPAQRIATEIFGNTFEICRDKSNDELDEEFKYFEGLKTNQGQINLAPSVKRNIRAMVFWVKDAYRTSQDPTTMVFNLATVHTILDNAKTHEAFIKKAKTLIDTATPKNFTSNTKWEDWFPSFRNFLRSIPGRSGIPLSYVIRDDITPAPVDPTRKMLDNYILSAPLSGEAFDIDKTEVHLYVIKLTAGNTSAEAKLSGIIDNQNGREDILALREFYEGIGINSIDLVRADEILTKLFYAGEKKPTMWWDEFERQLTFAFNAYERKEGRAVYSNDHKLRILTTKVTADFLNAIKSQIKVELAKTPMTMTYDHALRAFRNEVNSKNPPSLKDPSNIKRRLNEVSGRGRGRGRGGRFGRGRGGGGRGHDDRSRSSHPEERYVTGKDGKTVAVHASYHFNRDAWFNLPESERKRLTSERQQYKKRKVAEANRVPTEVPGTGGAGAPTDISVITDTNTTNAGSIMGGRNEQQRLRSQNHT